MRSQTSETTVTEARDSIIIELRDTIREVTSITVQLNPVGDTVKVTTVTDRTNIRNTNRMRDVQEKIIVRTDTVYIEKESASTIVAGSSTEITPDGAIRPKGVILKWIFWILIAIIILIFTIKIFVK